jgi:hypothetical protein
MNLKLAIAAALLMASMISCGPDQPANSASDAILSAPVAPPPSHAPAASPSPAPAAAASAIDAPPKDARYTIYCLGVTGPDHIARANQVKILWQQATQRRDWYVVHQDDQSLVFFGYYRAIADPKDSDTSRAMADRTMIRNLKDTVGDFPFQQSMLMPLDAPDPNAPPQWNLLNAKGAWTLEIAAYKGPGRKAAAVESVRQARAQGVEAYYYHGPTASSVCIGAWPQEAVIQHLNNQMQNSDPNQAVMVVPDVVASQMPDNFTDKDGNQTKVVHNDAQVVDPSLQAMMQKYPTHSLNGYDDTVVMDGKTAVRQSAVMAIPHTPDASSPAVADQPPAVNLLGGDNGGDSTGTDTSGGRLRSMGQ